MSTQKGHEEIDLKSLTNLSVKDGALYWKGKKLTTDVELHLSGAQKIVAGALSALVAVAAIVSPLISYFANLDNICKNTRNHLFFCPTPAVAPKTPDGSPPAPSPSQSPHSGAENAPLHPEPTPR